MGLRRKIKKFLYNLKYPKNKFIIDLNKKKVLITGSNSGIGLSLAKKILEQDNQVFATYREKSDKLDEIKSENLFKIKCDQSKIEDYTNLETIRKEVNASKNLFKKNNWPVIDVTRRSVEETAASILKIIEIKKNK